MPTREIAGRTIEFDDENFMTDYKQWDEEIAKVLAADEGHP